MASPLLAVTTFWNILILSRHSVAAFLDLNVQPTQIAAGLTTSMTINCTFSYESSTNFSGLLSLIVSKADRQNGSGETQTFQDLVSLNAFHGEQINPLSCLTATVTGVINIKDDSFISLLWTYPSENESGLYRCAAYGVDKAGHPVDVSKTEQVTAQTPDMDQLLAAFRDIRSRLQNLEVKQDRYEKKRTEMMEAMFMKSAEFEGRHYLLSKQYFNRADVAEAICEQQDGYLAEIGNYREYAFIWRFLSSADEDVTHALLGATDEAEEGNWIHRFSRQSLFFTMWEPGNENRPDNDCLVLYKGYNWRMGTNPCTDRSDFPKRHFLCECPLADLN